MYVFLLYNLLTGPELKHYERRHHAVVERASKFNSKYVGEFQLYATYSKNEMYN
jgi:hypothetical protein